MESFDNDSCCVIEDAAEEPPQVPIVKATAKPLFSVISSNTRIFKEKYFPDTDDDSWNSWRWQIKNRIQNIGQLKKYVTVFPDEEAALIKGGKHFPFAVTPYYLSLVQADNPDSPIRRAVIPSVKEFDIADDEKDDPLDEEASSPLPGLIHRYPNRVLFLATDFCSTCCRYCTRARLISKVHKERCHHNWDLALKYIEEHKEIEDVLISGGDPLTLPLQTLERLLQGLSKIEHLKFIRLGTKVPVVLPQRITPPLVSMLKKYHPLFISIHFTHPSELTPEVKEACKRLANAGIPLGSQTVLLKGINDDVQTLRDLMMGLLSFRVRPYYLYQCDPIKGSKHFRTSVKKGLEMIQGLRGFISGYAIPHYVIDAPGGGGKIPLLPDYNQGHDGTDIVLKNYAGKVYRYPDTAKD